MNRAALVLSICDRFELDPDRAGGLDASVIGLLEAERELKTGAGVS